MHRVFLAAALLASTVPALSRGADDPKPAAPEKPKFEMESYQLVLLVRAPTWKKLPQEEAEALQRQHIGHLEAMAEAGKMLLAGPFSDQADPAFRGACIYRVGSAAEARALAEQDPAVKAGQLRAEVMTWWVGKGYVAFPKASPAPEAR